jgi:pimeloyl-ACP methyl ester carboxylesterase
MSGHSSGHRARHDTAHQKSHAVVSRDGTTIAFDCTGNGPALILVGDAFQHRSFDPRTGRLAELLSADFTVYHYDRRGRGDSADTAPYAVQREVEDIDALIQDAGGSAYVFGMSSSGAILTVEAAAAGLAISKLAVYEPPAAVGDSRPTLPAGYLGPLRDLVAAGRRGDAVEYFLTPAWPYRRRLSPACGRHRFGPGSRRSRTRCRTTPS